MGESIVLFACMSGRHESPDSPPASVPSGPTGTASAPEQTVPCASCGAAGGNGRFCSECGAPRDGAICPACESVLSPGARFCHRCGTAANAPRSAARTTSALPWAGAALALVALVALVAGRNVALSRHGASTEGDGGAVETPVASDAGTPDAPGIADASAGGTGGGAGAVGGGRLPDIASMSPQERADRLFDRVMRLSEEGKQDSVEFFAPMVMSAYQMLGTLDADQHYDVGRLGEVTGARDLARAEADTILRADPTHLLGLALAAHVAADAKQDAAARAFSRRLVAALPAERAKDRPEYRRHQHDIDAAVAAARALGVR